MNNYILKKIYIESQQKLTQREIKYNLKEKYNITIYQSDLNRILSKIKRPTKKEKYTLHQLHLILYLYSNCENTKKVCIYLNNKYEYNLTYQEIVRIAFNNKVIKKKKKPSSIPKITKEEEKLIVERYLKGETSYQLAESFGYKTHKSITDILLKNGINIKKFEDYVENITLVF